MRLAGPLFAVGLIAGLWAVPGCASRSAQTAEGDEDAPDAMHAEMALEVENHHWADVVIYLVHGSQPQRLGTVAAVSTAHFTFPYRHIGSGGNSRLRAYPIGGRRAATSDNLLVQPGQLIKWTLESDLSRSSLMIQ